MLGVLYVKCLYMYTFSLKNKLVSKASNDKSFISFIYQHNPTADRAEGYTFGVC